MYKRTSEYSTQVSANRIQTIHTYINTNTYTGTYVVLTVYTKNGIDDQLRESLWTRARAHSIEARASRALSDRARACLCVCRRRQSQPPPLDEKRGVRAQRLRQVASVTASESCVSGRFFVSQLAAHFNDRPV